MQYYLDIRATVNGSSVRYIRYDTEAELLKLKTFLKRSWKTANKKLNVVELLQITKIEFEKMLSGKLSIQDIHGEDALPLVNSDIRSYFKPKIDRAKLKAATDYFFEIGSKNYFDDIKLVYAKYPMTDVEKEKFRSQFHWER